MSSSSTASSFLIVFCSISKTSLCIAHHVIYKQWQFCFFSSLDSVYFSFFWMLWLGLPSHSFYTSKWPNLENLTWLNLTMISPTHKFFCLLFYFSTWASFYQSWLDGHMSNSWVSLAVPWAVRSELQGPRNALCHLLHGKQGLVLPTFVSGLLNGHVS